MKISIVTFGTIITFIAGSALLTSCGGDSSKEADSTEQHDMDGHNHDEMASATFSCPMHPEITGKEGDKCSKCGMKLTASKEADNDMSKMDMSAMAQCPMHPGVTGKEGEKCSKCGMALVLNETADHEEGEHSHED